METILNTYNFCYSSYFNTALVALLGIGFSLIAKATSAPSSKYSPEFYLSVIANELKFICLLIALSSLFFKVKNDIYKANDEYRNHVRVATVDRFGGYDNIRSMGDTMRSFGDFDITDPYASADKVKHITATISEKERVALSEFY